MSVVSKDPPQSPGSTAFRDPVPCPQGQRPTLDIGPQGLQLRLSPPAAINMIGTRILLAGSCSGADLVFKTLTVRLLLLCRRDPGTEM